MKLQLLKKPKEEMSNFLSISNESYAEEISKLSNIDIIAARKEVAIQEKNLFKPELKDTVELFSIYDEAAASEVGGFLIRLYPIRGEVFILSIHIYEEFRGKGYGKASLKLLHAHYKALGFNHIALNVFEENTTASNLYQKLGYSTARRYMKVDLD